MAQGPPLQKMVVVLRVLKIAFAVGVVGLFIRSVHLVAMLVVFIRSVHRVAMLVIGAVVMLVGVVVAMLVGVAVAMLATADMMLVIEPHTTSIAHFAADEC